MKIVRRWRSFFRGTFRRKTILLAKCLGVIIVALAGLTFDAVSDLSKSLQQYSEMQKETVVTATATMESIARSFQASFQSSIRNIDSDEFRLLFERTQRNYPFIIHASFAYRVNADARETFEAEIDESGMVGYKVFSRRMLDGPRELPRKSGQLFPVVYSEPLEDYGSTEVGFDLGSSPVFTELIEKCVRDDIVLASEPYIREQRRSVFSVVVPLYSGKGNSESMTGEDLKTPSGRLLRNVGLLTLVIDPNKFGLDANEGAVRLDFRGSSQQTKSLVERRTSVQRMMSSIFDNNKVVDIKILGQKFELDVIKPFSLSEVKISSVFIAFLFVSLLIPILFLLEARREQLVRKNALLSEKIRQLRERETALTAARLRAETANEAKTRFLGVISHEIRTPLSTIFGYLDALKEFGYIAESGMVFFTKIEQSGKILLETLDGILDFSNDQVVGISLRREILCVSALCGECVEFARTRLTSSEVSLVWSVDKACSAILVGDSHRIRQVLTNLLLNAVKFTSVGKIELTVSLLEDNLSLQRLCFRLIDSGKGMDPRFMSQAFFPFSQEDDSLTRSYGGVGLGLSIVKSSVEAMKGTFLLESVKGEGTRVEVHLSLEKVHDLEPVV